MGFLGKLVRAAGVIWGAAKTGLRAAARFAGKALVAAGEAIRDVGKAIVGAFSGEKTFKESVRELRESALRIWQRLAVEIEDLIASLAGDLGDIQAETKRQIHEIITEALSEEVDIGEEGVGVD